MSDTKFVQFEGNYDKYEGDANQTLDEEMQEYNKNQNRLLGDLVASGLTWQSETAYTVGAVLRLSNGFNAECITAGTSGVLEPTWTEGEITDGTAHWKVSKYVKENMGTENEGKAAYVGSDGHIKLADKATYIKRSTHYNVDDMVMSGQLDAGKYLKCTTAGTTAAVEPLIEGNTVVDGTAEFAVATSGGGGGETYGIAPNPVTHRRKIVNNSNGTVTLYWKTGEDAEVEGYSLCTWAKDVIVKKQGSLPESPEDGIVVVTSTIRDQYYENGYVDHQSNGDQWYYRAFPYSEGNIYSRSRLNDFQYWFFGIVVDEGNPDMENRIKPLPYTDAYFYAKPKMDFVTGKFDYGGWGKYEDIPFAPKPCMLKYNGQVEYYLDRDNYAKKENGQNSNYGSSSYGGNGMAEFPKMFRYVYTVGNLRYVYLCSEQMTNLYRGWPFLREDGTYNEHFYLGLDESNNISSKLRCIGYNAKPTASTTGTNEMAYAEANGTGWEIWTIAQWDLFVSMVEIFFMSHDSENFIGIQGSSSSALLYNTGSLKDKGPFYGTRGSSSIKVFGIENPWGHRWMRIAGLMSVGLEQKYKLTYHTRDGSTTTGYNTTGSGYISAGITCPSMSESYIKKVWGTNDLCYAPKEVGGSATTYYGDGGWANANTNMLLVGASVSNGSIRGPWAWGVNLAPSRADWSDGASLSYTPR